MGQLCCGGGVTKGPPRGQRKIVIFRVWLGDDLRCWGKRQRPVEYYAQKALKPQSTENVPVTLMKWTCRLLWWPAVSPLDVHAVSNEFKVRQ